MTIVKEKSCNVEKVQETIEKLVPSAVFGRVTGTEIQCILPFSQVKQFPLVFEKLEQQREELGIGSFGVGSSTMEEIFLRSLKIYH